ncbi:putative cytochrome p450 [Lyophyllum shimeji]|uniref:Cytochrome p450 n=1 Tax=Lyophyllum shimeji TaxID=47721 RepID=A0A9P3ULS0_LYOSH|nr:putative cytochrome p450 [Lyophyllum shimeji]
MTPITAFALLSLVVAGLYKLYRRSTRTSVAHIAGPEPESFVLGNLSQLAHGQAAEVELQWLAQYGDVVRIKGLFGEDRLLISDPKALQYIFQTSGYNFIKQPARRELSRITTGKGLLWAEGDDHKRLRKVMLPGFSGPEAKGYLPVFSAYAAKVAEGWRDILASSGAQSSVVDIPAWISRCALDAIGEVAFDYQFGTLESVDNPLGKAFANLLLDTFGTLTDGEIFSQNFLGYIPDRISQLLGDYMPSKKLTHARSTAKLATGVAKELVAQKSAASLQGKGNRDIMSLLVKAYVSENERVKLNEEEMFSLMRVVILAGHETTANTFSWMLLELARRPEVQKRLRDEIGQMERTVQSRGNSGYTVSDLDSMPYLNAVLKETLRFHPVAINTFREAVRDDVLPLSKPIVTTSGEVVSEIPIPKGLGVMTSIHGYNRNKDIFGEDAHLFNPERWLNGTVKKSISVGVLGNLMTFSGGVRSCIGWKFAVVELQAFMFELIGAFEFLPTPESQKIRKEPALVMVPTIEGQVDKGAQLPLRIQVASKDEGTF